MHQKAGSEEELKRKGGGGERVEQGKYTLCAQCWRARACMCGSEEGRPGGRKRFRWGTQDMNKSFPHHVHIHDQYPYCMNVFVAQMNLMKILINTRNSDKKLCTSGWSSLGKSFHHPFLKISCEKSFLMFLPFECSSNCSVSHLTSNKLNVTMPFK